MSWLKLLEMERGALVNGLLEMQRGVLVEVAGDGEGCLG